MVIVFRKKKMDSSSSGFGGGGMIEAVAAPSIPYSTLMGILWSGTVFCFIIVTLRLAFRIKIIRRLRLDDYLVIASFVFCLASTLVWAVLARNLYVAIESSVNPDLVTILDLINKSATGLHAILASYLLTWTSIWLIKICFMVFFYGLGRQVQSQRYLWWGVFVYIIAAYCVTIGTMDYNCLTSNGLEIISKCRSQATLDYQYVTVRVQLAMDITTDIFIVLVSGNIVWRVSINWKKKLMLTCICCLTIAMVIVAVVRVLVGFSGKAPDLTWMLLWSSVEMTLAILVSCAASFRSLYSHTKNSQKDESLRLQQRSNWSKERVLKSSFNVTDTMVTAEVSLWERHDLANLTHSEEALWDQPPNDHHPGSNANAPAQHQHSQQGYDGSTITYPAHAAHQPPYGVQPQPHTGYMGRE